MPQPLRAYLEDLADRVEVALSGHGIDARVVGGNVGPRLIHLGISHSGDHPLSIDVLEGIRDDISFMIKTDVMEIGEGLTLSSGKSADFYIEFKNPNPQPVSLLNLLPELIVDEYGNPDPLPTSTALLGLTSDGFPLLARLASSEVAHILVAGATGSGKSVLLRTIVLSLLLTHTSEELQMMLIHSRARTFEPFNDTPHLLRSPIIEMSEVLEALRSLLRTMEVRIRRGESSPYVVVVVDDLADLIVTGGEGNENEIVEGIMRLVQRGREAGVHVVAATQRPSLAIMTELMRANFPLRLVGKVLSVEDARLATGREDTNAHLLGGCGDFLAVGGGAPEPLRFQAAYVGQHEIENKVNEL